MNKNEEQELLTRRFIIKTIFVVLSHSLLFFLPSTYVPLFIVIKQWQMEHKQQGS